MEQFFDIESATMRALFKLACRVKNCSTAGCGLSSLEDVLNSEYMLQIGEFTQHYCHTKMHVDHSHYTVKQKIIIF